MDIDMCQAVMKSDYAYTVTGIAVKCPEWQIPNNITDFPPEELPLQSDACVRACVCVYVCVCVVKGGTWETHKSHKVNILDFNVLVKSNGFPFKILLRLQAHSIATFYMTPNSLWLHGGKVPIASFLWWLHPFASCPSTSFFLLPLTQGA